jgi:DNA modification methylase
MAFACQLRARVEASGGSPGFFAYREKTGLKPYYEDKHVLIYHADARDVLPRFRRESIDMILTDPPSVHPTVKPVGLMSLIVAKSSRRGEIIPDPFCGSGPVLRAARDLGRRAVGIELEERYCEAAANRLRREGRS